MKHFSYAVNDLNALQGILDSTEITWNTKSSQAILVQIYCAQHNSDWLESLNLTLEKNLPNAIVVGATTVGEIVNGHSLTGQTVIGFSFFAQSQITASTFQCNPGQEIQHGQAISHFVNQIRFDVKALLLLSTPLSINLTDLFSGIKLNDDQIVIFGGGAGNYELMNYSMIFKGTKILYQGCVVVVFSGTTLEIKATDYLGWRPLSKSMTITGLDGLWVTHIDDKPAFDVYKTYLDIANDANFFINALEFPFLFDRDHQVIARVPITVDNNGALQFVADIKAGESFRLGYGDPNSIITQAKTIQQDMRYFAPEAIFMYSCGCRRFLMQEDVQLETLPFQTIAPSFGFYTYGEYLASSKNLKLLNSAMVIIGLREGPLDPQLSVPNTLINSNNASELNDPFANNHIRIIARLVKFISSVTQELEQTNSELLKVNTAEVEKQQAIRDELIQFITMLGHEVRTPLAVIDSIIQSLEFEIKEDQILVATGYQRIRQAINRVNHIISDVLVKERFGSNNHLLLKIDNWQVFDLIDGVLSRYGLFLPDELVSGTCVLEIDINTLSSKKLCITSSNYQTLGRGDLSLLQIILNNLLENAYKYGVPETDITLAIEQIEDNWLRFTIGNKVENFYNSDIVNLFEKYWRGSDKYNLAGAGLGLYLTKHLVEQHGGRVDVELCDNLIAFDVLIPLIYPA